MQQELPCRTYMGRLCAEPSSESVQFYQPSMMEDRCATRDMRTLE